MGRFPEFAGRERFAESIAFVDKVADIAAFIQGRPKADLVGAHWHEQRVLLGQRLSQSADAFVDVAGDWALLLAAEANRLDPSPGTTRTLAAVLERTSDYRIIGPVPAVSAIGSIADAAVLIARSDGTISEWTPAGGLRFLHATGSLAPITAVARSGDTIAWSCTNGLVSWCEVSQPRRVVRVAADGIAQHLALEPSGHGIIGAGSREDGTMWCIVWDCDGKVIAQIDPGSTVRSVHWGNGSEPCIMTWDQRLSIDVASSATTATDRLPVTMRPGPLGFNLSGELFVSAQFDEGYVRVGLLGVGDTDVSLRGFRGGDFKGPATVCSGVAIAGTEQRWCAAALFGSELWMLTDSSTAPVIRSAAIADYVDRLLIDAGGDWVVAQMSDRLALWSKGTSTLCRMIEPEPLDVPSVVRGAVSVCIDPSGHYVAWLDNPIPPRFPGRPMISTWDLVNDQRGPTLTIESLVYPVRFAEANRVLLSDGPDTLSWNLATGTVDALPAVNVPDSLVEPDYKASKLRVRSGGKVVLEVAIEGRQRWALDTPATMFAVSTATGFLRLFDLSIGLMAWMIPLPESSGLCFVGRSRLIALTDAGRLFMVSVSDGRLMGCLRLAPSAVWSLAVSPDETVLAVAGAGGTLTLINIDVTSWRALAVARAGRDLSDPERAALGISEIPEW